RYLYLFSHSTSSPSPLSTLSLHDALPIFAVGRDPSSVAIHPDGTKAYVANSFDGTVSIVNLTSLTVTGTFSVGTEPMAVTLSPKDRKSTRLNSSHVAISYAVFCLKKKNKQ